MSGLQATTLVSVFVVLAIILAVLFVILLPLVVFRLLSGPLEARVAAAYRPEEILLQDVRANNLGLESAGGWQARGNGAAGKPTASRNPGGDAG